MNQYPNEPQQPPYGQPPAQPGPYTQYPPQGQPGYPPPGYPQGQPGYPPPGYPQGQPPKKSKKGLWITLGCIIGAVVLCSVIANAASHSNTGTKVSETSSSTTKSTNDTTTSSQSPSQPSQQHFKVGDTVKVGDTWQAVVNSVKTDDGGEYSGLKSGDTYLVVDVSLTNLSSTEQNVSSILYFTLQDSTGQKYDQGIDINAGATLDGKVEAGQPLRGSLTYEVPASIHNFVLHFSPDIVGSGQTTWDLSV